METAQLVKEIIQEVVGTFASRLGGFKQKILMGELEKVYKDLETMTPEEEMKVYEILLKIKAKLNKELI